MVVPLLKYLLRTRIAHLRGLDLKRLFDHDGRVFFQRQGPPLI